MELTIVELQLIQEGLGAIECPNQDVTRLQRSIEEELASMQRVTLNFSRLEVRTIDEALSQWLDICADGGDTEVVTDEMRDIICRVRMTTRSKSQGG